MDHESGVDFGALGSDHEGCNRSLIAIFGKDPAALAAFYPDALRNRNRLAILEPQLQALGGKPRQSTFPFMYTRLPLCLLALFLGAIAPLMPERLLPPPEEKAGLRTATKPPMTTDAAKPPSVGRNSPSFFAIGIGNRVQFGLPMYALSATPHPGANEVWTLIPPF